MIIESILIRQEGTEWPAGFNESINVDPITDEALTAAGFGTPEWRSVRKQYDRQQRPMEKAAAVALEQSRATDTVWLARIRLAYEDDSPLEPKASRKQTRGQANASQERMAWLARTTAWFKAQRAIGGLSLLSPN